MADTRCKHCGERIVTVNTEAGLFWAHRESSSSDTYVNCRISTIATPEEAGRG